MGQRGQRVKSGERWPCEIGTAEERGPGGVESGAGCAPEGSGAKRVRRFRFGCSEGMGDFGRLRQARDSVRFGVPFKRTDWENFNTSNFIACEGLVLRPRGAGERGEGAFQLGLASAGFRDSRSVDFEAVFPKGCRSGIRTLLRFFGREGWLPLWSSVADVAPEHT